ncbi:hypothetical protein [Sphingomonas solaris]|uniref:hypothetical protein n=1 Tax=Alterirhizorhabdus solaris TaxID=2529389 RepID=UPI001396C83D|nr:hypothetical protein [Sphingomonas solaris]
MQIRPAPLAWLALSALPATAAGPMSTSARIYDLGPAAQALHRQWQERDGGFVIAIDRIRLAPARGMREAAVAGHFRLPLRDRVLLGGRETHVTVIWSAAKEGWAEGQVQIEVNGILRRATSRPVAAPAAGERLTVVVPAVAARARDGLWIDVSLIARQRGMHSAGRIGIDALEVGVRP